MSDESEAPEATEYAVELEDGSTVNVLEHTDEFSVSAGRKLQLDQYEPINEQATLDGTIPDVAMTAEQRLAFIMESARAARDICETQIMRRYEEYVREEAFGE